MERCEFPFRENINIVYKFPCAEKNAIFLNLSPFFFHKRLYDTQDFAL